jgi:phosphoribosylformylglycinamidine (FGAM) synthase PurS component
VRQWRFEVFNRSGFADVAGNRVLEDIRELGIRSVEAVQSAKVFLIEAEFDKRAFNRHCLRRILYRQER